MMSRVGYAVCLVRDLFRGLPVVKRDLRDNAIHATSGNSFVASLSTVVPVSFVSLLFSSGSHRGDAPLVRFVTFGRTKRERTWKTLARSQRYSARAPLDKRPT